MSSVINCLKSGTNSVASSKYFRAAEEETII